MADDGSGHRCRFQDRPPQIRPSRRYPHDNRRPLPLPLRSARFGDGGAQDRGVYCEASQVTGAHNVKMRPIYARPASAIIVDRGGRGHA